jgi:hypothetical protein
MKRLHIHVSVDDLAQSIHFYSTLFAAQPAITKPDYTKWRLDHPLVNFAKGATTCCYANSEKAWTTDPQGPLWESFLTFGKSTVYSDNAAPTEIRTAGHRTNAEASACYGPKSPAPVSASRCGGGAST